VGLNLRPTSFKGSYTARVLLHAEHWKSQLFRIARMLTNRSLGISTGARMECELLTMASLVYRAAQTKKLTIRKHTRAQKVLR